MSDTAELTLGEESLTPIVVPAEQIRGELDRILGSRFLCKSHRLRRFLQFVVEESLLGGQHRLKEYTIGVRVFDRREAFDPRVDSIVRVEARRLRAKLEAYYLAEGRDDSLRIRLHKGSYVPVFEDRGNSHHSGGSLPLHSPRRSIAIARPAIPNGDADYSGLAEEIQRRLTHILVKEGCLQVIACNDAPWPAAGVQDGPRPDYVIETCAEIHGEQFHLIVQLLNVVDSAYVWSESTDCDAQNLSNVDQLARALNRELQSAWNGPHDLC